MGKSCRQVDDDLLYLAHQGQAHALGPCPLSACCCKTGRLGILVLIGCGQNSVHNSMVSLLDRREVVVL